MCNLCNIRKVPLFIFKKLQSWTLFRTTIANNRKPAKVPKYGNYEKHQAFQDSKEVPVVHSDASENAHDEISKPLTIFQNILET